MKEKINELWKAIKNFFKTEWEKIKPLTFSRKVEYIWEYYKIPIIAVIALTAITVSLVSSIRKNNAGGEVVFGVGSPNDYVSDSGALDALAMGFGDYLGLVYGDQCVRSNAGYSVAEESAMYGEVTSLIMMVDASSGYLDAVFCQKNVIDYFFDSGDKAWIDLTTILDEDELKALDSSEMIYYTMGPDGSTYPCGIYLKDSKTYQEYGLKVPDVMLAFPAGAKHIDYIDDFLDFMFAE